MEIRLQCPECERWFVTGESEATLWNCPYCQAKISGHPASDAEKLSECRVCGNQELYRQKDFPHWLGMSILVVACLLSIITYSFYWITATWIILIGSAVIDGILYLLVGDVVICYRCQSQYRDYPGVPVHPPFELTVGEKYRQEKLRQEQYQENQQAEGKKRSGSTT